MSLVRLVLGQARRQVVRQGAGAWHITRASCLGIVLKPAFFELQEKPCCDACLKKMKEAAKP